MENWAGRVYSVADQFHFSSGDLMRMRLDELGFWMKGVLAIVNKIKSKA